VTRSFGKTFVPDAGTMVPAYGTVGPWWLKAEGMRPGQSFA
jgi:hypothetical protein